MNGEAMLFKMAKFQVFGRNINQFLPMSIETLTNTILREMPEINKWQRDFFNQHMEISQASKTRGHEGCQLWLLKKSMNSVIFCSNCVTPRKGNAPTFVP